MSNDAGDAAILRRLLQLSGLFVRGQAQDLASLVCAFPAIVRPNIFVEYELRTDAVLAGCGVGFAPGILDLYSATGHSFCESTLGREIVSCLEEDPFASDQYLNVPADADPDWVEYDVSGDVIGAYPFVFHRFPTRYRSLQCGGQLDNLLAGLPEKLAIEPVAATLGAAVETGPIGMYRIGWAPHRMADWWRIIIDRLDARQIEVVLRSRGMRELPEPIAFASQAYDCHGIRTQTQFSLSFDICDGQVDNVDVECPYFLRFEDAAVRRAVFEQLLALLVQEGTLRQSAATWLAGNAFREVSLDAPSVSLTLAIHHLKFRCIGSQRGRAKAYWLLGFGESNRRVHRMARAC